MWILSHYNETKDNTAVTLRHTVLYLNGKIEHDVRLGKI